MSRQLQDYSDHVRKHPSPSVRVALVLAGSGSIVLGITGIFLPVLLGIALGAYLYRIPSRDRS